jgi:membrane-associated phospholipid phosphatase
MTLRRRTLAWIAVACGLLYAALSLAVAAGWLDAFDARVHAWVVARAGGGFLGAPWALLTAVGSGAVATVAVAVAAFLSWRAGAGRTALVILVTAMVGGVLVEGFKDLHGRPYPTAGQYVIPIEGERTACPEFGRCDRQLGANATVYCPPGSSCYFYVANGTGEPQPFNPSYVPEDLTGLPDRWGRAYPSGHTMGATLSWGLALLLGVRALQGRRSFDGWAVATWAGIAVVGGLTRLPVHAHWITDVVGSWLLGGMLLATAILLDDLWSPRDDGPVPPWRLRL